jgi:hypothetical protein
MKKPPDNAFAWGKTAVQNVAVEEIFDESPDHAAREKESYGDPGMRCRKRDSQHEDCVHAVESGQRVETIASEGGLTPLVSCEEDFSGPLQW